MRQDFTHVKTVPVLICFIRFQDKFLLLKRSDGVLAYKNLWSTLAGFIDDKKSLKDKIAEEITEELGLEEKDIIAIREGETYTFRDKELGRDWVRHLFLAEVSNPNIRLDWEHTEYRWISPSEIQDYQITPGLAADLSKVMAL